MRRSSMAASHAAEASDGVRDGTGTEFDALWRFLIESRFLYPEKLASIQLAAVRATLTTLLAQRSRLFRTLLLFGDGCIEGHVAAALAYRSTFVIQHLAARSRRSRTGSRSCA